MSTSDTVCGFIGLGSQGKPIAWRMMEAGYPLVVWARRSETLAPFRGTEATCASDIADLANRVNYVGICVVGDDGVTQVCHEVFQSMREGGVIVNHSTVLPDTVRRLARQAKEKGLFFVDAPVSGGSPAAEAGALTLMLGGDAEVVKQIRPVLQTFSRSIFELGDVGDGQKAKLINNSLMAANMGLAHSAVTAGVEMGLDRESLVELLAVSSGRSFALDVYAKGGQGGPARHAATLLDKVRLLGQVVGKDHKAYGAMSAAASSLQDE